jgi:hypothetical protein
MNAEKTDIKQKATEDPYSLEARQGIQFAYRNFLRLSVLLTFKFFKFYEESPPPSPSPSRGEGRVGRG